MPLVSRATEMRAAMLMRAWPCKMPRSVALCTWGTDLTAEKHHIGAAAYITVASFREISSSNPGLFLSAVILNNVWHKLHLFTYLELVWAIGCRSQALV